VKLHKLETPEATFEFGERFAGRLAAGDVLLLTGGLGAGKTLLTKGILSGLGFDPDEVTSPSFSLVNLYKTPNFDVYHIDLWRIEPPQDAAAAVGLDEILDDPGAAVIIEWADRLTRNVEGRRVFAISIDRGIDEVRHISVN
jgi:tRNA threonylcarbamoyladenosine biosynthesis protein TsaE